MKMKRPKENEWLERKKEEQKKIGKTKKGIKPENVKRVSNC